MTLQKIKISGLENTKIKTIQNEMKRKREFKK
jgi:hypothetical protein